MEKLPNPSNVQYLQCASLVAKVMIADDHRFTQAEIETARELVKYQWNRNVTDFLYVVAGIFYPGRDIVTEAYYALVFQYDKS